MISAYLDRFEGDLAVLLLGDEEKKLNFPREFLPEGASDGDYLKLEIELDEDTKERAEQEALALLQE